MFNITEDMVGKPCWVDYNGALYKGDITDVKRFPDSGENYAVAVKIVFGGKTCEVITSFPLMSSSEASCHCSNMVTYWLSKARELENET